MAVPGIAHTAAKGAVWSMTRQLAMEGAKHQIRCNSISPGPTVTNQTEAYIQDPAFWDVMGPTIMLGRPGRPEDIAGCALYLSSAASNWVTGADFRVDGGMTAWVIRLPRRLTSCIPASPYASQTVHGRAGPR